MGANLIRFFIFVLATMLAGDCADAGKGYGNKNTSTNVSQESQAKSITSGEVPSDLLPTLKVAESSCYVYLRPNPQSPYFGPLLKGEWIKRLDTHGDWIRVWIPRLVTSGWVYSVNVYATRKKTPSQESVPEHLLSAVTVLTKRGNIREYPTTRSKVILEAEKGQEFLFLTEQKDWYQIWIPRLKKKGWIHNKIATKKAGKTY